MTQWSDILDADVGGERAMPPHVEALKFPRLSGWEPGRVWATWEVVPEFLTPMGSLFGGYLAALADHVMANALFSVLTDEEVFSTTDLQTNFLRPVREGVLAIDARVVQRSRRSAYCEVTFGNEPGELFGRAGATQAILVRRDSSG